MGCIPSSKFRVIHRSLGFEAIEDQDLLKEILEALEAKKGKKPNKNPLIGQESESRGDGREEVNESASKKEDPEAISKTGDEKEEENGSASKKEDPEAISKIVSSLARLEQSHMEQNKILVSVNEELKNEGVDKVCRMEDKIRSLKEALGAEEKEETNFLDRPNPAGSTLLHASSTLNDGETTRLLLEHEADPTALSTTSAGTRTFRQQFAF